MKALSPKLLLALLGLLSVTLLVGAIDLKPQPAVWEYKTLWLDKYKNPQGKLNELGAEAWELVVAETPPRGGDSAFAVFKRVKQ